MKTRGEKNFVRMPWFATMLYDSLTNNRGVRQEFEEIADFIGKAVNKGKLLDVGTGPGRLLYQIHEKNPLIELYGLDISASMLAIAAKYLKDINNVSLKTGNISAADFPDQFFDCIVSTGSFYLWDNPVKGVNEIFRILKHGKSAYLFESYSDYEKDLLDAGLERNLHGYFFLFSVLSKKFLKKQLRMTYSVSEFDSILQQSEFKNSYKIQKVTLGNLPIFVRLELNKN